MKSHILILSLSNENNFGYLNHHYDFITVFDLGGVLMFLTNMQVKVFDHPTV